MPFSRRDWLVSAASAGALIACRPALFAQEKKKPVNPTAAAPAATTTAPAGKTADSAAAPVEEPVQKLPIQAGGLTEEGLGTILESFGLKPEKSESRYDFIFAAKVQDEEWKLSMSAVLSADQQSIWVMAWLDELPRSYRDVPRSALLGLLATNDKMGKGRFFSYIPTNRRFVLQQVIDNRAMSSAKVRTTLVELGQTVALTYPQWSTAGWKEPTNDEDAPAAGTAKVQATAAPAGKAPISNAAPARTTQRPAKPAAK